MTRFPHLTALAVLCLAAFVHIAAPLGSVGHHHADDTTPCLQCLSSSAPAVYPSAAVCGTPANHCFELVRAGFTRCQTVEIPSGTVPRAPPAR